ncbi:MAG TPA: hypothetical protein VF798_04070 [Burkholderiaceae bacterium]
MPDMLRRRVMLAACAALTPSQAFPAQADAEDVPAPPLRGMIADPLLVRSLYRLAVSHDYGADGAAGANRSGYRWIEEQRQGAEWIVRGYAQSKPEWMELGWRELDWGLARQQSDGSFASKDPFHSTSFFVEALARACLIDPGGITRERSEGLAHAAHWLMSGNAEEKGIPGNRPYTHRRYILAAAFGQAGAVTGESRFTRRAERWAGEGLGLQRADGTNPEKNGYDVGYQMVGVLMALRYLPVCANPGLRVRLRDMVRRAVQPEIERMAPDGSIDLQSSTRVGKEHARNGKLKDVPYGEIMQALVYGAHALSQPQWMDPAERIARLRGWFKS